MSIKLAGLIQDSITDGPGLRATVFVQGCPRRCKGCHNPTALPFEGGTEYTVENLFDEIAQNPLTMGVTFSGGEPFCQAEELARLGALVKGAGLELAVYTGYTFEQLQTLEKAGVKELLQTADILIDGEFILEKRNLDLPFRGSENQRLLDLKASLAADRAVKTSDPRWTNPRGI